MKPTYDPNEVQRMLDLLFGGRPAPKARHEPTCADPRDDTRLHAILADYADRSADAVARATDCGCPSCGLLLPGLRVQLVVSKLALRAVLSGDRSKLDALAARAEEVARG